MRTNTCLTNDNLISCMKKQVPSFKILGLYLTHKSLSISCLFLILDMESKLIRNLILLFPAVRWHYLQKKKQMLHTILLKQLQKTNTRKIWQKLPHKVLLLQEHQLSLPQSHIVRVTKHSPYPFCYQKFVFLLDQYCILHILSTNMKAILPLSTSSYTRKNVTSWRLQHINR